MKLTPLLLVALVSTAAYADPDLDNCKYPNGNDIPPKMCDFLRDLRDREQAAAAENDRRYREKMQPYEDARKAKAAKEKADAERMAEQQRAELEADRAAAAKQEAERAAADAASRAKWLADDERRKAAWDRAREEEAAAGRREAAADKARRAECGKDYASPRVGMALDRAQRCVGNFTLYAESAGVQTYQAGRLHLTVSQGRIVRWFRF